VIKSLALLALAIALAISAGVASLFAARLVVPDLPAWAGLVFGVAALVAILAAIARRFAWIMPWYYVLPAIVFLLTFTFFPILLTFWLAFTDYSGIRNGQLNIASATGVVAVEGREITIADPAGFNCADLRNGCVDVRAVVFSADEVIVAAESYADGVLTLVEALPRDRTVVEVELLLPDLGFYFTSTVVDVDGRDLVLERAVPFPPALEEVRVQIADRLTRTIVAEDGARLTLDAPLPGEFAPTAIARYNDYGFIGWRNFRFIVSRAERSLLPVFTWNVSFAVLTVLINTIAGVFLAVLLNNPDLRFRNLYRTLLIIPWALPNIITIQVWKGLLNQNFGAINRVLMLFDVTPEPVNWLVGDANAARAAVLLVNLWLGLPFMMTATLGALSAIPRELYESAKIDGASALQTFWGVTAPLLRTALVPITLTGFAFNFNNFNIIFLLTDGGPPVDWGTATARGTDILISWAYNEAFRSQGGYAYGLGSAISILIFLITVAVSLVNFRVTGALKEDSNT
jgi:arabinogalactan oligomer / maltooligosaccharide transport system permease protein